MSKVERDRKWSSLHITPLPRHGVIQTELPSPPTLDLMALWGPSINSVCILSFVQVLTTPWVPLHDTIGQTKKTHVPLLWRNVQSTGGKREGKSAWKLESKIESAKDITVQNIAVSAWYCPGSCTCITLVIFYEAGTINILRRKRKPSGKQRNMF